MAVILGTNSGFVTVAPTADPEGTNVNWDTTAQVMKHTLPADAVTITEMGWYCDNATEEANFEVGIYDSDGAVVPGEAGTLLQVSRTNAKGTTAGWKVVSGLSWDVSAYAGTVLWLGMQLDDTATATALNYASTGGAGVDNRTSQTTLPNPFGGGALASGTICLALYAVYTTGGGDSYTASGSLTESGEISRQLNLNRTEEGVL